MEKEKTFEEIYPKWVLEEAKKRFGISEAVWYNGFERTRPSSWKSMKVVCNLIKEFCTPPPSQAEEVFLKISRIRMKNPSLTLEKALWCFPASGAPILKVLKEHFNEEEA